MWLSEPLVGGELSHLTRGLHVLSSVSDMSRMAAYVTGGRGSLEMCFALVGVSLLTDVFFLFCSARRLKYSSVIHSVMLIARESSDVKHLSPDPAVFPLCNAAMGGAKLITANQVACHVANLSPDSRKEIMLSLLTGLGKTYCCILLPQIKPEGKVLSSLRTHDEEGKFVGGTTS